MSPSFLCFSFEWIKAKFFSALIFSIGYCFMPKLQKILTFKYKGRGLQQTHSGTEPYRVLSGYLLRSAHA